MSFRLASGAWHRARRETQDNETQDARRQDDETTTVKPDDSERRSRDTRPQPAWRPPATPCKAAQPPPPPAMKRLALLLPLLALADAIITARAENPATKGNNP